MKPWSLLLLGLAGCAGFEPAGGQQAAYVYSPHAPANQPNPMVVELAPSARPQSARPQSARPQSPPPGPPPPILNPQNSGLPRPHTRDLSGPASMCKDGLVIDLLDGERAHESNASLSVSGGENDFRLEAWTYELPRDSAFLSAAGSVTAPGLGELARIKIAGADPTDPRFTYVLESSPPALFRRWSVSSPDFDGSPADLALLARVRREVDRDGACSRMP